MPNNMLDRLLKILNEAPDDEAYSRRELLGKLGLSMRSGGFDFAMGSIGPEFQMEKVHNHYRIKFYGNPVVIQALKDKQ